MSQAEQATQLAQIQAKDSFETKSQNYSDPVAYSYAVGNYLLNWRNTPSSKPGYINQLDYIQALLRQSGLSDDTTQRGIIGNKDIKAMQDVSRIALQNGIPFLATLENLYTNKSAGEVKFNKNIATAIKLLDPTDAKSTLSNEYYRMFGEFPAQNQIDEFMKLHNAEATRQQTKSITTSRTKGDVSTSATTSMNEGFTEKEQQQFLADYLVKNFDVAAADGLGGQVKSIYDQIVSTYRNNFLPEPDLPAVAGVIKQVISSADDKVATQTLSDYINQQRRVASKQFLGIQNELLAGDDVMTYAKPLQEMLRKSFGRTVQVNDKLIVQALNYKDEKGNYRPMNEIELNNLVLSDPRYATSPMAIQQATALGETLTRELGR
jgi:hypothetical protein